MPATTPVPAPPATEPVIGLLASITPYKGDDRWMNPEAIITYRPEGCNEDGAPDDMCSPATFTFGAGPAVVEWKPYFLSVTERCSTYNNELTDESTSRITRLMRADTERQLGAEFWDGDLAQVASLPGGDPYPNMYLANTASDDLTVPDTNKPPANALTCLDSYLTANNSGAPGAIHATIDVIGFWKSLYLLREEVTERGIRYFSPMGNLVIGSPGYSGNAPDGVAPGVSGTWAYATDMPRIFLGPILVHPIMSSIDYRNNTVEALAQRPALVEWPLCRHAAVRTSIVPCSQGGS